MREIQDYIYEGLLNKSKGKYGKALDDQMYMDMIDWICVELEDLWGGTYFRELRSVITGEKPDMSDYLPGALQKAGELGEAIKDFIVNHLKVEKVWDRYEHMDWGVDELKAGKKFERALPTHTMPAAEIKQTLLNRSKNPENYEVFKNVKGLDKASHAKIFQDGVHDEQFWIIYDDGTLTRQRAKDFVFHLLRMTG